jgi:hypothetical protein
MTYTTRPFNAAVAFDGTRHRSLMDILDDTDFHPELGEPERQDRARGTGTNDQNVPVHQFRPPSIS